MPGAEAPKAEQDARKKKKAEETYITMVSGEQLPQTAAGTGRGFLQL